MKTFIFLIVSFLFFNCAVKNPYIVDRKINKFSNLEIKFLYKSENFTNPYYLGCELKAVNIDKKIMLLENLTTNILVVKNIYLYPEAPFIIEKCLYIKDKIGEYNLLEGFKVGAMYKIIDDKKFGYRSNKLYNNKNKQRKPLNQKEF